jgi:hypothetical protein
MRSKTSSTRNIKFQGAIVLPSESILIMASKSEGGSEDDFDESWIMIDDMPENHDELDESVLNPVSARSRTVSNLVQKMLKLKPKRSTNCDDNPVRRKGETAGRPQAGSDNRGGVISVFRRFRSRSSTFDGGQRIQGERSATSYGSHMGGRGTQRRRHVLPPAATMVKILTHQNFLL